jgi:hypothetical protein
MCEATNSESSRYDYRERLLAAEFKSKQTFYADLLPARRKFPAFVWAKDIRPAP